MCFLWLWGFGLSYIGFSFTRALLLTEAPFFVYNYHMHIKKVLFGLYIALFLLLCYVLYESIPRYKTLIVKNVQVRVVIGDSPGKRAKGLMNAKSLSDGVGFMAVFDRAGRYGVWMKNMQIPIDVIWLNSQYKVVDIKQNAQPCHTEKCEVFMSSTSAQYVLELNGGWVTRYGLSFGDCVTVEK